MHRNVVRVYSRPILRDICTLCHSKLLKTSIFVFFLQNLTLYTILYPFSRISHPCTPCLEYALEAKTSNLTLSSRKRTYARLFHVTSSYVIIFQPQWFIPFQPEHFFQFLKISYPSC